MGKGARHPTNPAQKFQISPTNNHKPTAGGREVSGKRELFLVSETADLINNDTNDIPEPNSRH